ncbi:hypothetical protein [Echinicola vietnamensis]|uniref:GyrI-like small molecule binding domain-containing protein n=1 Tax=Echinicola vietnamensis (strain DSM 17526 / LMG 23754 / KMM 6221) TaxID=926556 RepID=L0FZD5_ECHVK|nr:hypothetical protein [Echinicola vietnamensis]AGA77990.1 hypothetical protein Echvi_1725 [Echinicola vietnamensis DSM 17526]
MKKTLIVVGILAALGFSIFAYLGGFKDYPIAVKQQENLRLYGLTYKGTPQDEGLKNTFKTVEAAMKDAPEAILHTIYYVEPAGKLDTMSVFVGLDQVKGTTKPTWEEQVITAEQFLVADLHYHKLVMPRPETIKSDLQDYAETHEIKLQGIFIDRLLQPDHVQVWAPIAKKK